MVDGIRDRLSGWWFETTFLAVVSKKPIMVMATVIKSYYDTPEIRQRV